MNIPETIADHSLHHEIEKRRKKEKSKKFMKEMASMAEAFSRCVNLAITSPGLSTGSHNVYLANKDKDD